MPRAGVAALAACCCLFYGARPTAAVEVRAVQKISDTEGDFRGALNSADRFGCAVAAIGDLDGDMTNEVVVGAFADDDNGTNHGAVYVLFLRPNGTVRAEQKISDTQGNFQGVLGDRDLFGVAICSLGDVDGDATQDVAVATRNDDDGGPDRGAVYVVFLHPNGTVKTEQKISHTQGNFRGGLRNFDLFGSAVGSIGDLDGDTVQEVVVGAQADDDGGRTNSGAVYVLFLHPNGTVKAEQKISDAQGNFQGRLRDADRFGNAVAALGDLDGDRVQDLAVGAFRDNDGGDDCGAVYVLFLHPNGTVKADQKISDTEGNFQGGLNVSDQFGFSLTGTGDLDGDATQDVAVGADGDNDGERNRGAVYVLFLNSDGTVKAEQKISDTPGSLLRGMLDDGDHFGTGLSASEVDGDSTLDLVVGASFDDDGGTDRGAVYVLFLEKNVPTTGVPVIGTTKSVASTTGATTSLSQSSSSPTTSGRSIASNSAASSADPTALTLVVVGVVAGLCLVAALVVVVVVARRRSHRGLTTTSDGSQQMMDLQDLSCGRDESGDGTYHSMTQVQDNDTAGGTYHNVSIHNSDAGEYHNRQRDLPADEEVEEGDYHNRRHAEDSEEAGEYHNRQVG
jgi:FG-GAP repeat